MAKALTHRPTYEIYVDADILEAAQQVAADLAELGASMPDDRSALLKEGGFDRLADRHARSGGLVAVMDTALQGPLNDSGRWHTVFLRSQKLEDYDGIDVPLPVLENYRRLQALGVFSSFMICSGYLEDERKQGVVLAGTLRQPVLKRGKLVREVAIARWADEPLTPLTAEPLTSKLARRGTLTLAASALVFGALSLFAHLPWFVSVGVILGEHVWFAAASHKEIQRFLAVDTFLLSPGDSVDTKLRRYDLEAFRFACVTLFVLVCAVYALVLVLA